MKHHYIPQFYLRPWLGADNKLLEFRQLTEPRRRLEIKRRGTNETGFVKNLYSLPGTTRETRENVERIFMGVVDKTAADARDMLLQGIIIPQGEIRAGWARFLLSLMLRNPEEMAQFKERVRSLFADPDAELRAAYVATRDNDWPATVDGYFVQARPSTTERIAIVVATRLMQNPRIIRSMMRAHWLVIDVDRSPIRLMSSDYPLVIVPLARSDAHFGLPISPTKLFVAFMDRGQLAQFARQDVRRIVRLCNEAVVGQGRRSVYAQALQVQGYVEMFMGTKEHFLPLRRG